MVKIYSDNEKMRIDQIIDFDIDEMLRRRKKKLRLKKLATIEKKEDIN